MSTSPLRLVKNSFFIALLLSLLFSSTAQEGLADNAKPMASPTPSLDVELTRKRIKSALQAFYTPGMAVGVVHKGEVIFLEGAGAAVLSTPASKKTNNTINPQTYFRLASTSKAFTAAALAILVDEGKIAWTDKVIKHLPEFQMQDPWITREFTIEDLLTHRSGLIGGAGDSMIWPEPSGFSAQEVIERLKFLSPASSFRSQYAYSNVLYITAGELVSRVSKQSYGAFVEERIFKALDMDCFAGDVPAEALNKAATPYGHNDERGLYPIPRNAITAEAQMSVAAGGIVCNAESMTKWLSALLQPKTLPFSEASLNAMWTPRTLLNVSSFEEEWDGMHFKTYGYGWRMANIQSQKVIYHTGTLSGYQAYVALIPELELGVVILNNGSNYGARSSVMQHILKSYLPQDTEGTAEKRNINNWVKEFIDFQAKQEQRYLANQQPEPKAKLPMVVALDQVIGRYEDAWFGEVVIEEAIATEESTITGKTRSKLRFSSSRMTNLRATLTPFENNKYKAVWDNQNAASNAFLLFELNLANEVVGFTMHPFSSTERSRHAYRDMHFIKQ
jgi:CubicO group peptidase (beta-lactamase class C family)